MKKVKDYIYTILVVCFVLGTIFLIKGVYPFGKNSLIWGDMHDQITTFYYHLYDCVYGNNSLFVNFFTGGGINFLGIIAYYILSPFSLLVLLIPRSDIYLMVSVIIACKIITSSITCLYFLKTYFKNMPSLLHILLAIIYAFSGYSLMMYQITPWIDAMYMFPLIMIGLKKVLDLEKPTFYITTLTISLICSFYVSVMSIIFIFFVSFIYLLVYIKKKEERKKSVINLGLSTIISLLISSFIIIPSILQIKSSSRIGVQLNDFLYSKMGPIVDKFSMFLFGGLVYVGIILLLKSYKKHKQFLKFYIPTLLILLIPVIIEPINKVWHFGAYVSFPYRFGFITMFFLIVGAAYFFNSYKDFKPIIETKYNNLISIIISVICLITIFFLTYKYHLQIEKYLYKLSLSFNKKLIIILFILFFISFISMFIITIMNKKLSKFYLVTIFTISLVHIFSSGFIYLGMSEYNGVLNKEYDILNEVYKDKKKDKNNTYLRLKNTMDSYYMITNNGIVSNYPTLDHFTSLTSKNTLDTLKKLGYGSRWVMTYSRGGSLFMDSLFGIGYLMSDKQTNNPYYTFKKTYQNNYLYEFNKNTGFGFLIDKSDTLDNKSNAFEIYNSLYKNILNTKDDLFEIDNKFNLKNKKKKKLDNELYNYSIKDKESYLEKTIKITNKKNVYIQMIDSGMNNKNKYTNHAFDLYVNDKLYIEDIFKEPDNGVLDLGIHENETIKIRIKLKQDVNIKGIVLGYMDISKYDSFLDSWNDDISVKFNKNKIDVKVDNKDNRNILVLPISYDTGYKALNNGKNVEVLKIYDNFIGIKLDKGVNNISISYTPNGLIIGLVISIVTLIISIILLKSGLYMKIVNNTTISNIIYPIYTGIYALLFILMYILLSIWFVLSYII